MGYIRVSTESQAERGASLAEQRVTLTAEAERRGWDIEIVEDAGRSAADIAGRPALAAALDRLDLGDADVLMGKYVARLSRSVADFAGLADRAQRRGWQIVALDVGVDMSTPAGEMVSNVLASVAQYERKIIAQRTREGMGQRRAEGWPNGAPGPVSGLPETTVDLIASLRAEGMSMRRIADELTGQGVRTVTGGAWHASTVRQVLMRVAQINAASQS